MMRLLPSVQLYFDQLQNRMVCLCRYGCQCESWLKTELITFLDTAKAAHMIRDFGREVKTPVGKVDITVTMNSGQRIWVELKHWLIGRQAGSSYQATFYFCDPTNVGITPDVKKLIISAPR